MQHRREIRVLAHMGQVLQLERMKDIGQQRDPGNGVAGLVPEDTPGVLDQRPGEVVQATLDLAQPLRREVCPRAGDKRTRTDQGSEVSLHMPPKEVPPPPTRFHPSAGYPVSQASGSASIRSKAARHEAV